MNHFYSWYTLLTFVIFFSFFESSYAQETSVINLKSQVMTRQSGLISGGLSYRGTSTIPGLPQGFKEYYEAHGIQFEHGIHLSITPEGLEYPIFFIWDGNFQDYTLWIVHRSKGEKPVFRKSMLQDEPFNKREALKGIAEIKLDHIEQKNGTSPVLTMEIRILKNYGMVFYRSLDFTMGKATIQGTVYNIALVRKPNMGIFIESPNVSLLIDKNQDGIFTINRSSEDSNERYPTNTPFFFARQQYKVNIFNPFGSRMRLVPADIDSSEIDYIEEGFPMPEFSVEQVESGKMISLASLKGKVVVINWWFTTCPPCIEELPQLNTLYQKYKGQSDVFFLAIAIDSKNNVEGFLESNHFFYKQALYNEKARSLFGSLAPRNIVIDQNGKVVFDAHGGLPDASKTMDQIIHKLLNNQM